MFTRQHSEKRRGNIEWCSPGRAASVTPPPLLLNTHRSPVFFHELIKLALLRTIIHVFYHGTNATVSLHSLIFVYVAFLLPCVKNKFSEGLDAAVGMWLLAWCLVLPVGVKYLVIVIWTNIE